jgi:hypothetical protein
VIVAEDLALCSDHRDSHGLDFVDDGAVFLGVVDGHDELADVVQQPPREDFIGVAKIGRLGEHPRGHGAADAVLPEVFLVEGAFRFHPPEHVENGGCEYEVLDGVEPEDDDGALQASHSLGEPVKG